MAKPDWGELQQRFLSDHAATGVSPKDWCEAQGLNYATARRYIKKPSAQTAQKPAQKKLRTAQKEKCAEELVDDDGLTAPQRLFVVEYLKDGNATQAAINGDMRVFDGINKYSGSPLVSTQLNRLMIGRARTTPGSVSNAYLKRLVYYPVTLVDTDLVSQYNSLL